MTEPRIEIPAATGTTRLIQRIGGAEPMIVEAWSTGVPGLSVVPFIWSDERVEPGWYRLNHDASGLAFPYGWPSRAAVKRCAMAVADVLDWTAPFDDLRSHPAVDALREAGRAEGVLEWDLWWRLHGKEL